MDWRQVWNESQVWNEDSDTHNDALAGAVLVTCRPKQYQLNEENKLYQILTKKNKASWL
jgi:hypothetical protein